MADLLGSILKAMDKPPSTTRNDQRTAAAKKQEEAMRKIADEEKRKLKEFKASIEKRVNEFIADESKSSLKFEPMEKVQRTIVHDVCDANGLYASSFGLEAERHTVIYKQDAVPSEEELAALRRGEIYDPEKAALKKVLEAKEELESLKKKKIVPVTNYREKYEHLIGKDTGKEAATIAKPSEQFGLVPTALKRDQRSIEEALNDIRSKKKLRQELLGASTSDYNSQETISTSSVSNAQAGKDEDDSD